MGIADLIRPLLPQKSRRFAAPPIVVDQSAPVRVAMKWPAVSSMAELAQWPIEHSKIETAKNLGFTDGNFFGYRTGHVAVLLFSDQLGDNELRKARELLRGRRGQLHAEGIEVKAFLAPLHVITACHEQSEIAATSDKSQAEVSDALQHFIELCRAAAVADASDVHIILVGSEAKGGQATIKFRIDGRLIEQKQQYSYGTAMEMLRACWSQSVSGSTSSSDFELDQLRKTSIPLEFDIGNPPRKARILYRFQSIDATNGGGVVMRLTWEQGGKVKKGPSLKHDLIKLGFLESQAEMLVVELSRPEGGGLIVGPTGEGKTRTLYTILAHLADGETNIVTLEDPVEQVIDGILQKQLKQLVVDNEMQTEEQACAEAVAGLVRFDLDVGVIGEMRNNAMAKGFENVVLGGHLALSTLHAQSSLNAFYRLTGSGPALDMDIVTIPDFLRFIVHQKLVAKLCQCAIPLAEAESSGLIASSLSSDLREVLDNNVSEVRVRKPDGCPHCSGRGEIGRTACIDLLFPNDELLDLIKSGNQIRAKQYLDSQKSALHLESFAGKTVSEIALYKVCIGEVDPTSYEKCFGMIRAYLNKQKRNEVISNNG